MAEPFPACRSILFVPGDRPDRYEKALAAGADAVCIDLEDAVAPDRKTGARASVTRFIAHRPRPSHATVIVPPERTRIPVRASGTPAHCAISRPTPS